MLLMRFLQIRWVWLLAFGELVIYSYGVTHHEKALMHSEKVSRSCLIYAFVPSIGSVRPALIAGLIRDVTGISSFMRQLLAANGFISFLGQIPYASVCDGSMIDILGLHIKVT
jgi:hypothetical protein